MWRTVGVYNNATDTMRYKMQPERAFTNDPTPRITIAVTDNFSTAADEITVKLTEGLNFTDPAENIFMRKYGTNNVYRESYTMTRYIRDTIEIKGHDGTS